MPQKKRPYVPKTRGCYECSRRRIHCDRREPECGKCMSKGLKCSGLGIRHRFNDGVASRGKWVGKTMENIYQEDNPDAGENSVVVSPTSPSSSSSRQSNDESAGASGRDSRNARNRDRDKDDGDGDGHLLLSNASTQVSAAPDSRGFGFFQVFQNTAVPVPVVQNIHIPPPLDSMPSWKRAMLHHFSVTIAREMIALDGPHNGWRRFILPMAEADELVMDAVLATAAFHQHMNQHSGTNLQNSQLAGLQFPHPNQLYASAIKGLKEKSQLVDADESRKHSILVTLLVLLGAVMVSGSDDFPALFRMLESAIQVMGDTPGLGQGELPDFIMQQVRKIRVYSAPLLSEETGLAVILSQEHASGLFECLGYSIQPNSESADTITFVTGLANQARMIYLEQAMRDKSGDTTISLEEHNARAIQRVQVFKDTLEDHPENAPGQEVIVWATFMAASAAQLPEHREFFAERIRKHHSRSGFGNLLKALESLHQIWARPPEQSWTSLLSLPGVLIM